jgi:hypothetical protein
VIVAPACPPFTATQASLTWWLFLKSAVRGSLPAGALRHATERQRASARLGQITDGRDVVLGHGG